MKVRYIGEDLVTLIRGKVYDVMSVEHGWYRVMTELDEDYLIPPKVVEIVGDSEFNKNSTTMEKVEF